MKTTITNQLITQLKPESKPYDVRDAKLTGFLIRVNPTGKMSYVCQYKRGRRINIGPVDILTPMEARQKAKDMMAGDDPHEARKVKQREGSLILEKFLDNEFNPWFIQHYETGEKNVKVIKTSFAEFLKKSLPEIKPLAIQRWRTKKLEAGQKPATVTRDINRLKSVLARAVEWEFIKEHPLKGLDTLKDSDNKRVRFLSEDEEKQLREALEKREHTLKRARDNANQWRKKRGYEELPTSVDGFADHMKPIVLLAMNTGLRRGELFNLTWQDIDLDKATLKTLGKNKKLRYVPLNKDALSLLKTWRKQADLDKLVFHNKQGKRFDNIRTAFDNLLGKADIKKFTFHDLRHHFASKLVMAGVDLNTVRELLGHADIKMTLRYAHLAPEHKARAVEKIVND